MCARRRLLSSLFSDPSPCPGRGQARLARAGEGSIHAVAYLHSGCAPRLQSLSLPISRSLALSEAVDFLDLGPRASKKVEHWRARLLRKTEKIDSLFQGEDQGEGHC